VGSYDDDLRFAHVLANAADDITTKRFRALDLRVETKPDLTPVSDADQATEDSLRNILRRSRPRDAVLGEESGQTGTGPRRWVIDPIDATKNYVRGVPVWATLIGLMDGDEVVVGVVTAPALGRRWWAAAGGGAWTGRSLSQASRCQVSQVTKLSDASFSYSGIGGWAQADRLDGFLALSKAVWRTRGFGDFWSHMLVAEGAVDISAEPDVTLWDLAALQVIVQEAGGRFTSLAGVATPSGGNVVCTNGLLHDEVLAHLADGTQPSLQAAGHPPRRLTARYAEIRTASHNEGYSSVTCNVVTRFADTTDFAGGHSPPRQVARR
jgi:histidinol-phosphatase